jgi:hypothetical protein
VQGLVQEREVRIARPCIRSAVSRSRRATDTAFPTAPTAAQISDPAALLYYL